MARRTGKAYRPHDRVVGWLAWFVVLSALWLVFISAWVLAEEVLGVFAAAVAATAAQAVREQGLAGFRVRPRWLWHARVLPWRAVRETGIVLTALARRVTGRAPVRGRFRVVPVTLPHDAREEAAKRALLTIGESFAPNTYVVSIDDKAKLMLTHELVSEVPE
jgi:multisubunit Na+/H+ antiporter MnhE subunit